MSPAYPRPYQIYLSYYLINLAGNGSPRTSSFATSYVFLTVDFVRPSGFKILRQELPDSHTFMRRYAPMKVVHWGSPAYGILP